ncbi:MAG: TolB family protein, partial [Candidatus Kariarchaeaceae archaeon]
MVTSNIMSEDYYKLKKIEDIRVSNKYVVWVVKSADPTARGYKSHIMRFDRKTGNTKQFTSGSKRDFSPRISPNGTKLAFISTRNEKPQLFIMDFDGGEALQVTKMKNGVMSPEWSPDSSKVAFLAAINPDEEGDPSISLTKFEEEIKEAQEKENLRKKSDPKVISKLVYRTGTQYKDEDLYVHIFSYNFENEEIKQVSEGRFRHSEFTWTSNDKVVCLSRRDTPRDLSTKYSVVQFDVKETSHGESITVVHNRSIDRHLPGPRAFPDGPLLVPKLDEDKNLSGQVLKWALVQADGSTKVINREL